MTVKVEKSRKGWQVSKLENTGETSGGASLTKWVKVCWFSDRTQAYAYAYALEHGL